jgi:hypothetical protein
MRSMSMKVMEFEESQEACTVFRVLWNVVGAVSNGDSSDAELTDGNGGELSEDEKVE